MCPERADEEVQRAAGPLWALLARPTRYLFFAGKDGAGKTAVSCAAALALADRGLRVLLVSTERTSNLGHALADERTGEPHEVTGASGLTAVHIDPAAARGYSERILTRARGALSPGALQSLEVQLGEAVPDEVATFGEFETLFADDETLASYDHVVFDTAPTGRTLRLLEIPAVRAAAVAASAKSAAGRAAPGAQRDAGATDALEQTRLLYEAALRSLRDRSATTILLVARPDPWSLGEAERTWGELLDLGISNGALIVNALLAPDTSDPIARAVAARGRRALAAMPETLARLPRAAVPLLPLGASGLEALRSLAHPDPARPRDADATVALSPPTGLLQFEQLIEELAAPGRGALLVVGKSGVGKTTIAVRVAVALAERGHVVHLCATCSRERLADALTLEGAAYSGAAENLRLVPVDAAAETAALAKEALAKAGPGLDEASRALLDEELRAPWTQEIAVLRAFARTAAKAAHAFTVVDTAPAGTTLGLLDAASAPDREVSWSLGDVPPEIVRLLPRLRDAAYARVLVVALPEASAVREALRLEEDLTEAGVRPYAWVVNQSLLSLEVRDAALVARRDEERRWIDTILAGGRRTALVPWTLGTG